MPSLFEAFIEFLFAFVVAVGVFALWFVLWALSMWFLTFIGLI